MKFAVVGEGLTDHIVLKNLLIGFFNNKDLIVNRLRPLAKEPGGWGNVLAYISSEEFENSFDFSDYIIIQIDTKECEEWSRDIRNIGDDAEQLTAFIEQLKTVLIQKIDAELYEAQKDKILFAICVHEIECWLLPFNTTHKAHIRKMVGCYGALEKICVPKGFSLNEKNYQDGKHYDILSKEMKDNKILLKKSLLHPALTLFINDLHQKFAKANTE